MFLSTIIFRCQLVYLMFFSEILFIDGARLRFHWPWNTNHTLYMEELCKESKNPIIRLSSTGSMSYGYLILSKNTQPIFHSANCTVRLKASTGHGVMIAFRKISTDSLCASYIQVLNGDNDDILSNPICGSENDKMEQNYIFHSPSESSSVKIQLFISAFAESPSFQLTFTSYTSGEFESCESATLYQCRNRKCVFKNLLCDGHNNCGDLSDELENGICNVPPVPSLGSGSYVGIVVSLLILVLIFLFIIVPRPSAHRLTWLRNFRRRRESRREPSNGNSRDTSRTVARSNSTLGVATVSLSVPIRYLPSSDRSRPQIREPPPQYHNPVFEPIDTPPPPYEEAIRTSYSTRRSRSH